MQEEEEAAHESDGAGEESGDQEENQGETRRGRGRPRKSDKVVKNKPTGLKAGAVVKYKRPADDQWKTTELVSRAAKKDGKYDGEWNTKNADDEIEVINFGKDTSEWEIVPPENVEVNYVLSCNEDIQTEVYLTQSFIKQNKEDVHAAKLRELASWKKNMVYDEVNDENQHCISARWVVKPKIIDGKQSVKARFVLRGFEEESERTAQPVEENQSVLH